MVIKSKLSQLPTWGALLIWTTLSVVAYGLVGFMFHFPSGFPPNNGENFNAPALVVGALQGGFTGLVIGSLQAVLLRQYFRGVSIRFDSNINNRITRILRARPPKYGASGHRASGGWRH
jgi:hypothetical protein